MYTAVKRADLLEAGDGVHEFDVQLGVVLSQGLVSVVADELHHRAEGQRVGEAVLPVSMVDLDQLVVPSLPGGDTGEKTGVYRPLLWLLSRRSDTNRRSGLTSASACSRPASWWKRPAPGRSHQACLSAYRSPPP